MTGTHTPRRALLLAAAAGAVAAAPAKPPRERRPQPGDAFVFAEDAHAGAEVTPGDIPLGGPQVLVWPMDAATREVRDGARANQVLLLKLDPASLDEATRAQSADGIIAYSAICSHAACVVKGWEDGPGGPVLKCPCHNSHYDPRRAAAVVFGPAPRRLAILPVVVEAGRLRVAVEFVGPVGPPAAG